MKLFILVIGLIFALAASASAWLITYAEYVKHYPDKKRPRKIAFKMAVATFIFFILLAVAIMFAVDFL